MINAFEIKGLTKEYPDFKLDNIDLALPSGCIMGLVGENGAGKTTLIKLLMNAAKRTNGQVEILGTDNTSPEFDRVKEDVGVVLDEAYFPEIITAANVNTILKNTYKKWNSEKYFCYIETFRLPLNKPFKDFSRGMKMKLAIAAALSHDPRLLILDEATSGLDPMVRDEILDIFNDFTRAEDHSVLLSSHIVSDLEKICDYIAFIHRGRLVFCEEKDRLLEEYAIVKLPKNQLEELPEEAVKGVKITEYGAQALVERSMVSDAFATEHLNLEDIILFLAKGDGQK